MKHNLSENSQHFLNSLNQKDNTKLNPENFYESEDILL